jgi:hypothetical protein
VGFEYRDLNGIRKLMKNNILEAIVFPSGAENYAIAFMLRGNTHLFFGLKCKSKKGTKLKLREFGGLDTVVKTLRGKLGFEEFLVSYKYLNANSTPKLPL